MNNEQREANAKRLFKSQVDAQLKMAGLQLEREQKRAVAIGAT